MCREDVPQEVLPNEHRESLVLVRAHSMELLDLPVPPLTSRHDAQAHRRSVWHGLSEAHEP
jgi:hypothetical protein